MQGLHADEMEDVKAVPVKQRIRPAVQEPALPPRMPSAAKTLLLFDFDKTLTDWDAGAALSLMPAPACLDSLRSDEIHIGLLPSQ